MSANQICLQVKTEDNAAEVFVVNSQFQLAGRGLGRLNSFLLDPGIYKLKVRTGLETREEHVVLREGDGTVERSFPHLAFSSPVPLFNTAKTHEFHIHAAETAVSKVHVKAGEGSWIFVFARDWTERVRADFKPQLHPHPARGLTLTGIDGKTVADLAVQSESNLDWEPWAACNVEVDPGAYRLSLETPSGDTIEQLVVASSAWQTQIFLLQRDYGELVERGAYRPESRRADLNGAAIMLSKELSFRPGDEEIRLAELARLGLTNQRRVLSSEVRSILDGKFTNPMLGIFGAQLLLLDGEPDFRLLRAVIDNLRRLLGPRQHPDVEALALLFEPVADYKFDVPPMLRRSWPLICNRTVDRPDLVPPDSLAAKVAPRFWGEEPWLIWMIPRQEKNQVEGSVSLPEETRDAVKEYLEAARKSSRPSRQSFDSMQNISYLQAEDEDRATSGEIRFADIPVNAEGQSAPETQYSPETIKNLTYRLGIPRASLETYLTEIARESKDESPMTESY
jgi:hypothetical protein